MRRFGQSSIFPSGESAKRGVDAVTGAGFPSEADIAHKTDQRFNKIASARPDPERSGLSYG